MTIQTAIDRLSARFGDRLSTSDAIRDHHGRNEAYYPFTPPDAVVFPETTEEVSELVMICADEGCPVVPWGVGTSLEGHALAIKGGITVDMSRMDKVLAIHPEDMDAVVQPGVTRTRLNDELRATGLFFSVDPGADATLGGMAATRASGTTAVRYGTMRENVLALEAVLADGRIIRTGTRARKSSAGYDLKNLLVGSEGTLGIITELTVRLFGQPEAISAATCAFDDFEGAVNTVITTIQMGIPMARMEFVDEATVRGFNIYDKTDLPEKPHLFIEFHGSEAGVKEQAETFGEIAAENGGEGFKWTDTTEARNALWKMRHNVAYSMLALNPGSRALTTDICVPISRLAEAVARSRADIDDSPLIGAIVGHVGDGNFHCGYLVDPANADEVKEAKRLARKLNKMALELGGTVTGEHGVGIGKKEYMVEEHGDAYAIMGDIKRMLDPKNILNPGKMVEIN
jgi:D-lactate dehydrogenase (cytochrome)